MRAAITSREYRENNRIIFDIDESGYTETGNRVITKNQYIDGTSDWVDWGFQYTDLEIGINGINLSHENFLILKDMQRDNDHSFLFHYLITTYPVIITEVAKVAELGDSVISAIRLTVSATPTDMETV